MERPLTIPQEWESFEFVVRHEQAGWRADLFVARSMPRLSRTRIQRLLLRGAFDSRGREVKPNRRLVEGEVLTIYRPPLDEPEVVQDFGVIFEDEHILVVDKPAKLPVHPTARYHKHTLTYLLKQRYGDPQPIIAHRLDAETSGLILCAKTKATERVLKVAFAKRLVEKHYLAVVRGVPEPPSGRIEAPLALNTGGQIHVKMVVQADGLPSLTEYNVLDVRDDRALVLCRPRTGRQHQIRVHLAHIGHPILGDKIYGPDTSLFLELVDRGRKDDPIDDEEIIERAGAWRQLLHAARLKFKHPVSDEDLELAAPLPEDMQGAIGPG